MITNHLYIYKHVSNEKCIYLSKEKKTHKHLKPTYLTNYLKKMKQIEDAI
jgi:hypothetical protein